MNQAHMSAFFQNYEKNRNFTYQVNNVIITLEVVKEISIFVPSFIQKRGEEIWILGTFFHFREYKFT